MGLLESPPSVSQEIMMKKLFLTTLGFASLLVAAPALRGQATPTATQSSHIQAGAGVMFLDNDYTPKKAGGVSAWADYDFLRFFHTEVGAEAELHFGGIITPDDIGENSYLIGPRFAYRKNKFNVYGKIMFGRATITNQLFNTSSSFNIYAFGGGVDYHVKRKINIRLDLEEQKWGNFEPHTLSPIPISLGVMYIIR